MKKIQKRNRLNPFGTPGVARKKLNASASQRSGQVPEFNVNVHTARHERHAQRRSLKSNANTVHIEFLGADGLARVTWSTDEYSTSSAQSQGSSLRQCSFRKYGTTYKK